MSTTFVQLKSITDNLNAYFTALEAFLLDPTKPVPSFEDYSTMTFDSILTDCLQALDTSGSYALGATTDLSHMAMAVDREFGMRTKVKSQYWTDAQGEAQTQADMYTSMYARYFNYFRGKSQEDVRTN